jgi:hypothetical protein
MNFKIKYLLIFVAIAAMVSSCSKGFEELNANPNQPSSVSTAYLLTAAQKQLMDHSSDEWWNGRRGNQLAQFWASNQYSSESRYQLRTNITNSYWIYFYAGRDATTQPNGGGMADLQEIIRLNTESPDDYAGFGHNDNQIAVATIMQAWVFQMLTDCFGDIPFSQALQGADFPNPAYDSQADVYAGIVSMLSDASNMIKVGEMGPQGDVIYNGDMAQWKMFANSLKLRAGMRMADANASGAETAVSEAVAAGVFGSNSDNAHFPYMSGAPNNNPINEDHKTRNDFCASNVIIDFMTGLNDPRMFQYFNANTDGVYVGEIYGLTEEDAALTPDASISQRSDKVLAADFPGTYMDYAEVEFFMAEAAERGWIGGSAEDHYNAGVQASMAWWGVAQDDIDAYMAQADVAYSTAAGTWQEKIGAQKWLGLYMQGIEGWTEYRRLDFGILQAPAGGALAGDGGVPSRMEYPIDEQSLNPNEYAAAVASQGADALDTKLWWDVN